MDTKGEILIGVDGDKLWRLSKYKIVDKWLYITIHPDNTLDFEAILNEWICEVELCSDIHNYKREVFVIQYDGDELISKHFFGMWPMTIHIPLRRINDKTTCTLAFDYWLLK